MAREVSPFPLSGLLSEIPQANVDFTFAWLLSFDFDITRALHAHAESPAEEEQEAVATPEEKDSDDKGVSPQVTKSAAPSVLGTFPFRSRNITASKS